MPLLCLALLLLITLCAWPTASRADWTNNLAQAKCDEASGTFSIAPFVDSSDGPGKILDGFQTYTGMGSETVHCKFGKRTLSVTFTLYPGSAGMCAGAGTAVVESLAIDNVELLTGREMLDRNCFVESGLPIRLDVHYAAGQAVVTECDRTTEDPATVAPPDCKTTTTDIDSLSVQYAKIDNDLADAKTQAAQAASKLPAGNDFATMFNASEGPDGLPDCAHWDMSASLTYQRFGRIAGKVGDRVYLHQGYPAFCRHDDDDACKILGYVIPGDRVIVNGICGAWSHITYVPRIQAKPSSSGWVKTVQLYAVDPIEATTPRRASKSDPIFTAIVNHDVEALKGLLQTGDEQAKNDASARALDYASGRGDLKMVDALLAAGVKPNIVDSQDDEKLTPLLFATYHIALPPNEASNNNPSRYVYDVAPAMKRLIAAGADVNAKDKLGHTALYWAIEAHSYRATAMLLNAGADVNATYGYQSQIFDDEVGTPLDAAADVYQTTYDPTFLELLLNHRADPNLSVGGYINDDQERFENCTLLMFAAMYGEIPVVRLLLQHGTDPTRTRSDGLSAADIARQAGFPKVAELIQQAADQWQAKHTQP